MVAPDSWTGYANRLRIGKGWTVVAQNDTTYTVGVSFWAQTDYTQGYNYDVTLNCYFGSHTKRLSGNAAMEMCYHEYTFTKQYGAAFDYTWGANASGTGAGPVSGSWTGTVPARPYSAPAKPASVTVTRVSDTKHTIRTQFTQSTAAPVVNAGYRTRVSADGGATWGAWSGVTNGGHSGEYSITTVANRTYQVEARNQGPGGNSPFTASAAFHTTPAAPTGATVTRNSDASHTVKWILGAAGSLEKHVVERQVDGGSWVAIASSVAASATSYTDTTTSANHRYAHRVKAVRGSLSSGYATTPTIHTTPAAPAAVTASRSGDSNVVAWTDKSGFESGFTVERSQDGGAYGSPVSVAAGVTSWTHADPALGSTWQYRVRANVTTPALSSAWATSNALALPGAPNAPTNLTATPATSDAVTTTIRLAWKHNPVDSAAQAFREVRYRIQGTTAWTTSAKITSSEQWWDIRPDSRFINGATYEWQVRTWGTITTGGSDGTGASPWSATATLRTSGTPAATINSPEHGSTLHTADLTVEWGFFDPEDGAQAAWRVELLRDGGTVETRQGTGAATTCTLATRLPDESAWTLRVCVQDAAGLWSDPDVAEFDVAYPRPPAAKVATVWDPDTGTVAVQITNPEPAEGADPAVANDVWRSIDDGPAELIATGVPPDSTVTDFTPTLCGVNTYIVTASTDLGAQSESAPCDQRVDDSVVRINGGPHFQVGCLATHNPHIDDTTSRIKELVWFDGRGHPVEFAGESLTGTLTLTASLPNPNQARSPASRAPQWRALGLLRGPHLWRDGTGRRAVVSLTDVKISRPPGGFEEQVTVTAQVIDDAR